MSKELSLTIEQRRTADAFGLLQPVCVRLIKDQHTEVIESLNTALTNTAPDCLQNLQTYVLFPLRIILKQNDKK